MYDAVQGTLGGTEAVDGQPVSTVPNADIAHTFTVVGLGLNVPIPAAPTGGSITVVARFVATRSGRFLWQCYAPCGSGSNSMGGAMSTMGWMEGAVEVVP
jgi:heme/copper-type cytochrome/quinol oxidase subunit 2